MNKFLLEIQNLLREWGLSGNFYPIASETRNWVWWKSAKCPTTCRYCSKRHGKIFAREDIQFLSPPEIPEAHPNCNCTLPPLEKIKPGTATVDGADGVDLYLYTFGMLPTGKYVTKAMAKKAGWKEGKSVNKYLPEITIGGDVYKNREGKLPQTPGRTWKEADINYNGGRRKTHRIVWSNDGLIFVTYDHFETFFEIRS